MYSWSHKSVRESKPSRKKTQTPSFSSTLLDEIYRSMDAGEDKSGEFNFNLGGGGGGAGGKARGSSAVEDEGIATLRRAFLVQKWMDMKVNAKNITHRRMASSLPEYFDRKPVTDDDPFFFRSRKPSCFRPFRPKPIKTDAFPEKHRKPISPGVRLTSFLNSLFTNGRNLKKTKDLNTEKIERTSKSTHGSTCSSASSFTRSCLSKHSPRSREKLNNGMRRTVRFYPVSVIIDEDCRPCGKKFIFGEKDFMKVRVTTMSEYSFDDGEDEDGYDDDDIASDASSDLFELDHLSTLKECDELPVYGTTHFGTNRAIANGLIC